MSDEPQRPASKDDPNVWKAYWTVQSMPWRTEPEIDEQRQRYLAQRRAVQPDVEKSVYPFRDENGSIRLTRADVEWLLATHRYGGIVGPVDWEAEKGREASQRRLGVDLRGASLRDTDLSGLPLASIRGGLRADGRRGTSPEHRDKAGVRLEGAVLRGTHLENARLRGAHLERAVLSAAHLQCAVLSHANLQGASLGFVHLEGADLDAADLEGVGLGFAHLEGATLRGAHAEGAHIPNAHLERADLTRADFMNANLYGAHLEAAELNEALLGGADLGEAHLEGANLHVAQLEGADLTRAYFDNQTYLSSVALGGTRTRTPRLRSAVGPAAKVRDVHWGGVDLTLVRWGQLLRLGDEQQARTHKDADGDRKPRVIRELEFENAARANRQLAAALRTQGLIDDADRFAYRAQLCQRRLLRLQRHYLRYLGSLFLWLIAGYGYKPLRSFIAYVIIIISAFAGAYLLNAQFAGRHLTWDEALVLSISAFHGRGFFTSGISLGDTLARLAAGEAIIGLLIEITFIATFTQRFFAR